MKTAYDVTIRVADADGVSVLLGAIEKDKRLVLVQVRQINLTPTSVPEPTVARKSRPRGDGVRGEDLVRGFFADGKVHSYNDTAKLFASKGFKPSSASGAISHLKTGGVLKQVGAGLYQIA